MKQTFLTTILFAFLCSTTWAQANIVDVVVTLKDGSKVEGLMNASERSPWQIQKMIAVWDESFRGAKKIKNKDKTKYKASELEGYEFNGRYFETKKVMIAGRGDHGSTLGALPKMAMIERLEEGEINVYKAYAYPPSVASGVSFQEIYADIRDNPEYFLMKQSDGKVKSMHSVDITKWIADAETVSTKFANGDYGNMKRKEGKGLGNFIKGQIENENPELILTVVREFNKEME